MTQWIFKYWWKRRLKKQMDDPNKIDLAVKELKSSAVTEVIGHSKLFLKNLEENYEKISKRTQKKQKIEEGAAQLQKESDEQDFTSSGFNELQIQKIKSLNRFYYIIITLFILAESYLYFLTAEIFLPGGGTIPKMILALFLAVVVMVILNYSFGLYYSYKDIQRKFADGDANKHEINKAKFARNWGYALMAFAFVIIISAAFMRIYFLEQVDTTGYTEEQIETITKVAFWSSVLTLAVTLGLAIFMAFAKRNQFENKLKLKVYKKWRENLRRLSLHTSTREKIIDSIKTELDDVLEKYWQLVLEVRRIYKLEYDENKKELYSDLMQKRKNGNLIINDTTYMKYEPIQSVDDRLFRYGILNADRVNALFEKIEATGKKLLELTSKQS